MQFLRVLCDLCGKMQLQLQLQLQLLSQSAFVCGANRT
jgi:hypothetical protein